jgi:hypothetical protein
MLKLNVLLVLMSAIIGLNKPTPLQSQQPAKQISFFDKKDTVVLQKEDYTLVQRQAGFDLLVLNKGKLKRIAKLTNPQSEFTSVNQAYRAVSVGILSSRVPDIGDYYFTVNGYRRIIIFKGNILSFKKTGY